MGGAIEAPARFWAAPGASNLVGIEHLRHTAALLGSDPPPLGLSPVQIGRTFLFRPVQIGRTSLPRPPSTQPHPIPTAPCLCGPAVPVPRARTPTRARAAGLVGVGRSGDGGEDASAARHASPAGLEGLGAGGHAALVSPGDFAAAARQVCREPWEDVQGPSAGAAGEGGGMPGAPTTTGGAGGAGRGGAPRAGGGKAAHRLCFAAVFAEVRTRSRSGAVGACPSPLGRDETCQLVREEGRDVSS